jgi:hypothetical protein
VTIIDRRTRARNGAGRPGVAVVAALVAAGWYDTRVDLRRQETTVREPPPPLTLTRDSLAVQLDPLRRLRVRDETTGAEEVWASEPSESERVGGDAGVAELRWADGTRVVANLSGGVAERAGLTLPAGGFLVDHPRFRAFHLLAGLGQRFAAPTLFVLRSLDGLPLSRSTLVRVFRGFGDPAVLVENEHGQLQLGDEVITRERAGFYVPVERAATVLFHDWYG